jgi:hypothetical protein
VPIGRGDRAQNGVEVIDSQRDMHGSHVARSRSELFAVDGREIFEQLDAVPGRFQDGDGNFRAGHAGDLAGQFTGVMGPMRKLEAENIAPESDGALEVGDSEAGVIYFRTRKDAALIVKANV